MQISHPVSSIIILITRCHTCFPAGMKYADATIIHKVDDKTDKANYLPLSLSTNLTKVYEWLIYNQMFPYFDAVFSKF